MLEGVGGGEGGAGERRAVAERPGRPVGGEGEGSHMAAAQMY